jgi:hypothetical protein
MAFAMAVSGGAREWSVCGIGSITYRQNVSAIRFRIDLVTDTSIKFDHGAEMRGDGDNAD